MRFNQLRESFFADAQNGKQPERSVQLFARMMVDSLIGPF